jgi:hypothetical protein
MIWEFCRCASVLHHTIDTSWTSNTAHFLPNGGILPIYTPPTTPAEARALTAVFVPNQVLPYSIAWDFGIQHVFAQDLRDSLSGRAASMCRSKRASTALPR